jgi:cytochrome c
MNFLDNFVLPQSAEHIELLHYMLMLIQFLFLPFISIIIGGMVLSLYYKKDGVSGANHTSLRFAREIIEIVTINKSTGIILGVIPVLTAVLIFAQLLHQTSAATVSFMIVSFLFFTVGIIAVYSYRYSMSFAEIFNGIKDYKSENQELTDEIKRFKTGNENLINKSGKYGVVFLVLGAWFFIAGMVVASNPNDWDNQAFIYSLFSWNVISKFIQFIAVAFALTGAVILFIYYFWEGGREIKDEYYNNFIKRTAINISFPAAVIIPIFMFINILALPVKALSGGVFAYSAAALILLFLAYHFLYSMMKEGTVKFSGHLFFVLLLAFLSLIIKDQLAMSNATQVQSAMLDKQFQIFLADLRGPGAESVVSGEEIFQVRCASCHSFDVKMVGPAYNDVLQKYENNMNGLISFIRNPTRIDPAYPPMPNPGLRPNEVEAVANYIMENYRQ